MLAARDQENLVHSHQTAAAAKPLNQNIRSFAPKTPGNKVPKTPFRIPLNDENNPLTFGGLGKQSVAGPRFQTQKENVIRRTGKDGEGEKGAFATPMVAENEMLYRSSQPRSPGNENHECKGLSDASSTARDQQACKNR
uniref:Uncharacterized protein n=1 Tax=Coccidioides posadasii RMSCC 3488 TaxID=454284 RepID=A0A0J6FJU5_COCPO|nr:hypothetical protein CPAG_05969 [Coccidioides posadasii RMSCC 3488]